MIAFPSRSFSSHAYIYIPTRPAPLSFVRLLDLSLLTLVTFVVLQCTIRLMWNYAVLTYIFIRDSARVWTVATLMEATTTIYPSFVESYVLCVCCVVCRRGVVGKEELGLRERSHPLSSPRSRMNTLYYIFVQVHIYIQQHHGRSNALPERRRGGVFRRSFIACASSWARWHRCLAQGGAAAALRRPTCASRPRSAGAAC